MSTSDEEESESDDDDEESEEDEEEGESDKDESQESNSDEDEANTGIGYGQAKLKFKKNVKGQGEKVPHIVKNLKINNSWKGRVDIQDVYESEEAQQRGDAPKKGYVIKKRFERETPKDLVTMLTRHK